MQRDAGQRCLVHATHEGPLRVLKTLYPEGAAIAHQVLVHPPGGIVGGDRLEIKLDLQPLAHAVLTTPGATRFYRSAGAAGVQHVRARWVAARDWNGCLWSRSRTAAASPKTTRHSTSRPTPR